MTNNSANEKNNLIRLNFEHLTEENDRVLLGNTVKRLTENMRTVSSGKAKFGEMSALEVLYELGRYMQRNQIT